MKETEPEITRNVNDYYQKKINQYQNTLSRLNRKGIVFTNLKLVILLIMVVLIIKKIIALPVVFVFLAVLAVVIVLHEMTLKKQKWFKLLLKINTIEKESLTGTFAPYNHGGDMAKADHPYLEDLDLFGDRSVFHYLNRTLTLPGRQHLAGWLMVPAPVEEIKLRQQGVRELAQKVDFRHRLIAFAFNIKDTDDQAGSKILFAKGFHFLTRKSFIFFIYVFPILTLSSFALAFFHLPLGLGLGMMSIQLVINSFFFARISRIYNNYANQGKVLKAYSHIFNEIESQSFTSEYLKLQQKELISSKEPVSRQIKRLSTLIEWFDVRARGLLHFIINNIFFWDFHLLYRMQKWIRCQGDLIEGWFASLGKIEASASLGNLAFNHPQWILPDVSPGKFKMTGTALGHPLIPAAERIDNDIKIDEDGTILLITGPNMAGKSTFLRTVGINIVLALAGSPVCAQKFSLSPVNLYSSMKISDSLDKKLSLFYQELLNLKKIIDAVKNQEPVFFIIDEMLKGTNTHDRQQGALALIRQLIQYRATGIVATHDLELTKLAGEYSNNLFNYHFDGDVKGDRLIFDYKLRQGVCHNFNALVLMKKMGIDI